MIMLAYVPRALPNLFLDEGVRIDEARSSFPVFTGREREVRETRWLGSIERDNGSVRFVLVLRQVDVVVFDTVVCKKAKWKTG